MRMTESVSRPPLHRQKSASYPLPPDLPGLSWLPRQNEPFEGAIDRGGIGLIGRLVARQA